MERYSTSVLMRLTDFPVWAEKCVSLTKDSISPCTYIFILLLLHFHILREMTTGWNLHGSSVDSQKADLEPRGARIV